MDSQTSMVQIGENTYYSVPDGAVVNVGDRVTYIHPVSKKMLSDRVVDIDGDELVLDRNCHHATVPLRISNYEVIRLESLRLSRFRYNLQFFNNSKS